MSFQTVPLTRQVSLPAGLILEGEKLVRGKEGTLLSRPGAQQHIYLLREQLSGILGSLIHGIRTRKEAGRKKEKGQLWHSQGPGLRTVYSIHPLCNFDQLSEQPILEQAAAFSPPYIAASLCESKEIENSGTNIGKVVNMPFGTPACCLGVPSLSADSVSNPTFLIICRN